MRLRLLTLATLAALVAAAAGPPRQLPAGAVTAFDAAVARVSEDIHSSAVGSTFLRIDALVGRPRDRELAVVRRGDVSIRELPVAGNLDDGILHHWVGTAFVPGASLGEALRLARDYDSYGRVFSPDIIAARLLTSLEPDTDRIAMRLRKRKLVTLTYDIVETIRYVRPAPDRGWSVAMSGEIHEVQDPGTPEEHARATYEGRLWRVGTWWRYLERDGGLWIENESLVLTDDVGFPASLVIGPLLHAGPREGVVSAVRGLRRELST